ncbi:hypothetical protein [Spirosoma harenae]
MKIRLLKKAVRCLIATSLLACPCLSSVSIAMTASTTSTVRLFDNPGSNNSVAAHNSTAKSDISPSAASTKSSKEQDKKAIGRCWKRLMTMVREVSHAHRKRTADPQ